MGRFCIFGHSYNLPDGYTHRGNARDHLAGNYNQRTKTEIEVYQILT